MFARRAELQLGWRIHRAGGAPLLLLTVTVRNIGLARLPLHPFGRVIRLYTGRSDRGLVSWQELDLLPVLGQHAWLEPQETVSDTVVIPVPAAVVEGGQLLRAEAQVRAAK